MKHITIVLSILFGAYMSFNNGYEKIAESPISSFEKSIMPPCGPTCNITDSLALVDLFNSAGGIGWSNPWSVLFLGPVCEWNGVTLRADGRVIELLLSTRNLNGTIPASIGNLTELEDLKLNGNSLFGTLPSSIGNLTNLNTCWVDNNNLNGSIPSSIGNLVNLQSLFIDGNMFSGSLPTEMGNLVSLMTFFMDNNEIEGEIPFGMTLLPQFRRFELFNNKIDSLPDFTGVIMNANWLKAQENRLTFDDILPNYGTPLGNYYHPQDSIGIEETQIALTGSVHFIDLDIDDGITDNEYRWFKDGTPYFGPTNSNQLIINPVSFSDAGVYTCEVTNPGAPLLTLYSRPITLDIQCGITVNLIELTLCTGTDTIVNGTTYDVNMPMGTEDVASPDQYGCDSIIQINLTFQDPPIDSQYYTLCPLGQIIVEGVSFNLGNTSGTVVIQDGIGPGCDSTIYVEVDFLELNDLTGRLEGPFCSDTSFTFNGLTYDKDFTGGYEILPGAGTMGCDSFLVIALEFFPDNVVNYSPTLCTGDSITINGNVYKFGSSSGTEIFEDSDVNGCDSIVEISLQFAPGIVTEFKDTLCLDDELIVAGTPYNFNNPSGTETFTIGSCDSVVNIELSFYPIAEGNYSETICIGDTIIINGEAFFQGHLSNYQTLADAALHQCDSFLNVTVNFHPEATSIYNETICQGDTIVILGEEFHIMHTSEEIILTGQSQTGCDSVVQVNVDFFPLAIGSYTNTICIDGTITPNSTTYSIGNPTGIDTIPNGSQNGCDSLVNVTIDFQSEVIGNYSETICTGDSITINGVIFSASNTSDTTTAPVLSQSGCDSLVIVTVDFHPVAMGSIYTIICQLDTIEINGVLFHNNNLTAITTAPTPSQNGCDSIVEVFLDFHSAAIGFFSPEVCVPYSIEINGNTYDYDRQSGQETVEGIAEMGCDSIIYIDLQFLDIIDTLINPTWCRDQTITINNVEYGFDKPMGTEIIPSIQSPGCDSVINIDLNFHPADTTDYQAQFCQDGFVIINGNRYDIHTPSGQEIVPSLVSGCDSVINIELSFGSEIITNIDRTLCPGESLVVDSEIFDANRPSGEVLFPAINPGDCDSTVVVALDFYAPSVGDYHPILCIGDNIEIGGVVFDDDHLIDTITLSGMASNGCDSIVNVEIDYYSAAIGEYIATLCVGDSININGTIYNQMKPNGVESFPDQSQHGCDSTLVIDLMFNNNVITPIGGILCFGESATVNGNVYDAGNPIGSDTFNLGGTCDSILDISFSFYNQAVGHLSGNYCEPTTFNVNGTTVGPSNPIDTIFIAGGSSNGCDSTVYVDLNYYLNSDSIYMDHLCYEDFVMINGERFDRDNPCDTFNFPGMGAGGCDSSLIVKLTFAGAVFEIVQQMACSEDSLLVNNVWYHKDNPTGLEVLIGGSSEGCDSTVDIRLSFMEPATGIFEDSLCDGASFEINGKIYDINTPSGIEVLENASSTGCDSTLTIDLTFTEVITVEIDTFVCQGTALMIGDTSLSAAGIHEVIIEKDTGCDSILMVTLEIEDPFVFGLADAGPDDIICEEFGKLSATENSGQVGFWTSTGTAIVDHINQFGTGTSNLAPGENIFIWSVSTDVCQDYSSDTAVITYYPLPIPAEDSFFIPFGINLFDLDLLENDSFPEDVASPITVNVNMSEGGLVMQEANLVQFIPQLGYDGLAIGSYEICGVYCPDFCLEVPFEIEIQGRIGANDDDWEVPNGITPNNDGVNDILIIDHLLEHPDDYPSNELLIFNRWGDVLFQAQPYNNDWDGKNQSGQDLPEGTYYYVLRLDIGAGNIRKGDITILR